jgi:type II secretory pathway pseudopilin PulG
MVCFRYIIVTTLHKGDKAIIIIIITIIIIIILYAIKKETEKSLKYTDLATEIQCMRNVKTKVIPVITRAAGTISKSSRYYPSNIPGKHEIRKL